MAPHTITPAVGVVCRCKAKTGLSRPGSIPLQSSFLVRDTTPNGGVKGSTRNGRRNPKCPSARRIHMVREDTGAPIEGVTCAWMTVAKAVGCTRAFLTMRRSSRRLVCRGRPESGLHANDISQMHWLQHLLTTQLERPN
ncbi:uncharacterized protein TNCV_1167181 [Trichonephila clavipes]|uniref:Uncharacterized protein n=1 Tax=Trichonephila clavipes TaxID=2585209 RepID=A0A8X6T8N3_TRICX|nr:uncharacterized protein TNCV_1167181 [Trichonephila clavipes]